MGMRLPSPQGEQPTTRRPTRRTPRRRAVAFRLTAILLGLLPFVLIEMAFRLAGWGDPDYRDDPFAGFFHARALFVPSGDGEHYETSPARYRFFQPDSFLAKKPDKEFRIFCLGGSTVQGRPFSIETSFTRWLEIGLRSADPRKQWKVVNCGGISYASYRLMPILQEVLRRQADLIVVYSGHNEFLEDRSYRELTGSSASTRAGSSDPEAPRYGEVSGLALQPRPVVITGSYLLADHCRIYGVLAQAYHRFQDSLDRPHRGNSILFSAEVEAMLDYRRGLAAYHRDDAWRRDVVDHYAYNLRRMVQLTRDAGVPLLLINPVSNLRHCRPFKSEHSAGLTPQAIDKVRTLCVAARNCYASNKYQAIDLYRQAIDMDGRYAQIYYQMAKCYDAIGDFMAAKRAYQRAQEEDVCPLRMLAVQHRRLLRVAERTGTPVVDIQRLFEGMSRGGIPGRDWLIDHVHPTVLGHQRIANAVIDRLISMGIVTPMADWRAGRDMAYQRHLASLDRSYFELGRKRLERLRRWAQGRATRRRTRSRGVAGYHWGS